MLNSTGYGLCALFCALSLAGCGGSGGPDSVNDATPEVFVIDPTSVTKTATSISDCANQKGQFVVSGGWNDTYKAGSLSALVSVSGLLTNAETGIKYFEVTPSCSFFGSADIYFSSGSGADQLIEKATYSISLSTETTGSTGSSTGSSNLSTSGTMTLATSSVFLNEQDETTYKDYLTVSGISKTPIFAASGIGGAAISQDGNFVKTGDMAYKLSVKTGCVEAQANATITVYDYDEDAKVFLSSRSVDVTILNNIPAACGVN